jgi:hypothetical protein
VSQALTTGEHLSFESGACQSGYFAGFRARPPLAASTLWSTVAASELSLTLFLRPPFPS